MDRGVRAIVSHRLPNAKELEAGCGDWLECCQAYIHAEGCVSDSARLAAEEIVPDCLSRTCFMEDCGYDHCWGCDDSKKERERVAAVISKHFATTPADNDAESLLQYVAHSGIEFDGQKDYVVVQIDRDIWQQVQAITATTKGDR